MFNKKKKWFLFTNASKIYKNLWICYQKNYKTKKIFKI